MDCKEKQHALKKMDKIELQDTLKPRRRTGIGVRNMSVEERREYRRKLYKSKDSKNPEMDQNWLISDFETNDGNYTNKKKNRLRKDGLKIKRNSDVKRDN